MADAGEKQHQPFEQQLKQQQRRGQVWQSRELTSFCIFATGIILIVSRIQPTIEAIRIGTLQSIQLATAQHLDALEMITKARELLERPLWKLIPFLLALTVVGVLVPMFQVGPLLTLTPLTPKLRFTDALKRMFGKDAFTNVLKSFVKMLMLGAIGYFAIRDSLPQIFRLQDQSVLNLPPVTISLLKPLFMRGMAVLAAFAILDVFLQRQKYRKQMMITTAEYKEQYKENEGNPEIKQRQRQASRDLVQALLDAQTGQVVIKGDDETVVLRLDPKRESVPRVVAKGRGQMAVQLRKVGRNFGMYEETNRWLAKALFAVKVRSPIPLALYTAAAEAMDWAAKHYRDRSLPVPWQPILDASAAARAEPPIHKSI